MRFMATVWMLGGCATFAHAITQPSGGSAEWFYAWWTNSDSNKTPASGKPQADPPWEFETAMLAAWPSYAETLSARQEYIQWCGECMYQGIVQGDWHFDPLGSYCRWFCDNFMDTVWPKVGLRGSKPQSEGRTTPTREGGTWANLGLGATFTLYTRTLFDVLWTVLGLVVNMLGIFILGEAQWTNVKRVVFFAAMSSLFLLLAYGVDMLLRPVIRAGRVFASAWRHLRGAPEPELEVCDLEWRGSETNQPIDNDYLRQSVRKRNIRAGRKPNELIIDMDDGYARVSRSSKAMKAHTRHGQQWDVGEVLEATSTQLKHKLLMRT